MSTPDWFRAIKWSSPIDVDVASRQRKLIPSTSGIYVFTNFQTELKKSRGVLYVGQAKNIRRRVKVYLADPARVSLISKKYGFPTPNKSLDHAAKVQLLVKIQQRRRSGNPSHIFVRWTETNNFDTLERQLVAYLQPALNERLKRGGE